MQCFAHNVHLLGGLKFPPVVIFSKAASVTWNEWVLIIRNKMQFIKVKYVFTSYGFDSCEHERNREQIVFYQYQKIPVMTTIDMSSRQVGTNNMVPNDTADFIKSHPLYDISCVK